MKILLFDIETSPNIAHVWGKYEQNVVGDFIKERQLICFAWKWLGEKEVHVLALPDFKGYKKNPEDNRELVLRLHELISQADVVIGHNVDNFDDKRSNTEFIRYGLTPPPPHKTVDTLKVARSKFNFNSNKLDDLGKFLGLGKKTETGGFSLWLGCLRGEKKSWVLMKKYNQQDVSLLEKIYLRMRPWMTNHPNVNVLDGNLDCCPVCKSGKLIRRGWSLVGQGKKQRFLCQDCGKWAQGKLVESGWKFR